MWFWNREIGYNPSQAPLRVAQMICKSCGKEIPETTKACPFCGQLVSAAGPQAGAAAPVPRNALAAGSLVCGLLSVVLCLLLFPVVAFLRDPLMLSALPLALALVLGVIALVMGFRGLSHVDEKSGQRVRSASAVRGIVFGCVGLLLVYPVYLLGLSMERPHEIAGNEASAVGSLRQYLNGCIGYSNDHPERGYPPNLSVLGPEGDGYLDAVLAPPGGVTTASRYGQYNFSYAPGKPDRHGLISSFTISARPVKYGKTGRRSFFVDETGFIRFTSEDRAATAHDTPLS